MIVIGYLHHMFVFWHEQQFAAPYVDQLTFIGDILTILMIVGAIGVIWYGFVKDLLRKRSEKNVG